MNEDIARRLLNEKSALLVTCSSQSWIQARRLVRRWTKVRDREMEQTVRYLDEYASADNLDKTLFVTDPYASHEMFPGLWAHQDAGVVKDDNSSDQQLPGIQQTLQEVFVIGELADLAALNRRRVHNDEREREFDFQDGRGDQVTLDFPFLAPTAENENRCMALLSEADLLTLAPAGYQFHQRRWEVDQDTHTATLTLQFKAVEWNAWGHSGGVADYTEFDGLDTEEETKTRTWVNIRNADVPTGVEALRSGAFDTAGYEVRMVSVQNSREGACDLVLREKKVADGNEYTATSFLDCSTEETTYWYWGYGKDHVLRRSHHKRRGDCRSY